MCRHFKLLSGFISWDIFGVEDASGSLVPIRGGCSTYIRPFWALQTLVSHQSDDAIKVTNLQPAKSYEERAPAWYDHC